MQKGSNSPSTDRYADIQVTSFRTVSHTAPEGLGVWNGPGHKSLCRSEDTSSETATYSLLPNIDILEQQRRICQSKVTIKYRAPITRALTHGRSMEGACL